jgi:hypothetical protein
LVTKHKLIKTIEEKNECLYCMYCGSKLKRLSLNVKKCPNDCVEVTFKKPSDAFRELLKETEQERTRSPRLPSCSYPMIS